MERIKTKYYNLIIIHPHSGKVSRSVITKLLKRESNAYFGQNPDNKARWIGKWYGETVILQDVNNKISIYKII